MFVRVALRDVLLDKIVRETRRSNAEPTPPHVTTVYHKEVMAFQLKAHVWRFRPWTSHS